MISWRMVILVITNSLGTRLVAEEAAVFPGREWAKKTPAQVEMDSRLLERAKNYALTGSGSGCVTRHGYLVMTWGDQKKNYGLKSTTKSIGVTSLGLAIKDGKLKLTDKAIDRHPSFGTPPESNAKTGWLKDITLKHLATQTAGFEKPGGYKRLQFPPGSKWAYSDGGPNWLAECVTIAYGRDVNELMFERVFTPIGITRKDLAWRNNAYRNRELNGVPRREFGSGISANVNAMARIGYLYLRDGTWKDQQILPREFVQQASGTVKEVVGIPEIDPNNYGNASDHYGLLWWNNADGAIPDVPKDAYWSWGLHESLIVVIPSLDLVAARAGNSWKREKNANHYSVLKGFLQPLAASVKNPEKVSKEKMSEVAIQKRSAKPPYPQSPVFQGIEWAPQKSIIRLARGSDNWPMTWADDDRLYTVYGDGYGFEPFVGKKLSMGLCMVSGNPPNIKGQNIRSETLETTGGGQSGKKGSGMLMVDGVLYLWVRNAKNSQLAWSKDHGKTWQWSEWKFTTSFGCPAFLQFGKNHAHAKDGFVYVYSHDSDSAYQRADRMVMARVPEAKILSREDYEFFEKLEHGKPRWTKDIKQRGAVFTHKAGCYRCSVSYHKPSGRYLWCQTGPGDDTRFKGGLGIFDAPEPWGPWTTVFSTDHWDVGSGETSSFPPKWMDETGHSAWLVFSGDDHFSIRKATFLRAKQ